MNTSVGDYIFEISYIGYHRLQKKIQLTSKKDDIHLGRVYLKSVNYTLNEATITSTVPDIVVRGDTIEYNADSYRLKHDALLKDLVSTLPGILISADGKLMVNGKVITKILIDGKEFFDNDIDLAMRNLPASMINKLQILKEQSETSKITGFKDGDTQHVINLTVKEGYKHRIFGEGRIGYGTDQRYSNKVSAQMLADDNQYALIANTNNVTDDFEYSGLSSQYDGITTNKDIGFNFNSQRSESLKVGGNIKYDHNDNLFNMDSNTRSFIQSGDRIGHQTSTSRNIRKNLRTGTNVRWTPDTLTTIHGRINISTGTNDDIRESRTKSYVESKKDTTLGKTNYLTNGDTYNLNSSLTIGRKLNNKGRTASLSVNGTLNGNSSNGFNKSNTIYQNINQTKVIDQSLSIDNSIKNWSLMLSLVEPLSPGKSIQFSYLYRSEKSDRERLTFKKDEEGEYTSMDSAYSRNATVKQITERFNISFQSQKEKFEYTIGINIDPASSSSKTSIGDSIIESQEQRVINISPSLRFSYKPRTNLNFDFDYYGAMEQPSLRQLSADTIIIDALSKIYGNPNLKPSYQNNLNVYLQKSNYEKGSFFTISGGGHYTFNKIVDYTFIDGQGNSESSYRNVQGNWGLNGGIMFNTPLSNKKITIDNTLYGYLMQNIGYSNRIKNITRNLTMSEGFSISYRSNKLTQRLQANVSYNITRNNLPNQENLNVINYGLKSSTKADLPHHFILQNEISYFRNIGYSDEFKKSELLWNISLSKQLLKRKQGTLKIQAYDIFNDRNNVLRVTSGNYISDTRTNMIGRYFLVSFGYRFNITPKGTKDNSLTDDSDMDYMTQ
jgi:hypothetical protein